VLARTNARKINISVTLDPDLLGAVEAEQGQMSDESFWDVVRIM
jgi:hypothetical protein